MTSYITEINEARAMLRGVCRELDALSSAVHMAGNERLADKLDRYIDTVMAAEAKVDNAVALEIAERCNQTMTEMGGIIEAALKSVCGTDQ